MKVLIVTTISNTINAFLMPHIISLVRKGYQVDLAFNKKQNLKPEIENYVTNVFNVSLQRSPLKKGNFYAYKMLKHIIKSEKYDIVHTHTPVASTITRLVCRKLDNVKVFYTAHGFHFFQGAPLLNWILYYPIEKTLSRYTDLLITINKEDYNRAKNNFKAKKVVYIPGIGINYSKFVDLKINKELKRQEFKLPTDAFVVLSVGELNKNKNHRVVIEAISHLKNNKIHYLICGEGKLKEYLTSLSHKLNLDNNVHFLGYREDIEMIGNVADVFLFPSKREGLGLAAIEAMALGLPLITSNIHGIRDYSIDGVTGYTVKPSDVKGIAKAIFKLYNEEELRIQMGKINQSLAKKYDISNSIEDMMRFYNEVLDENGKN